MAMNDGNASNGSGSVVESVYALRTAAIDHGLALAGLQLHESDDARYHVLETQVALEEKTAATIDLCAESSGAWSEL